MSPLLLLIRRNIYGGLERIRTPDPRFRRPMLYPAELLVQNLAGEQGIEPWSSGLESDMLPLHYSPL